MSSKYIKIFFTPLIIVEILISTTASTSHHCHAITFNYNKILSTPLSCDYLLRILEGELETRTQNDIFIPEFITVLFRVPTMWRQPSPLSIKEMWQTCATECHSM